MPLTQSSHLADISMFELYGPQIFHSQLEINYLLISTVSKIWNPFIIH